MDHRRQCPPPQPSVSVPSLQHRLPQLLAPLQHRLPQLLAPLQHRLPQLLAPLQHRLPRLLVPLQHRLPQLLVQLLLLTSAAHSAAVTFQLTSSDQASSLTPVLTSPGDRPLTCALRCLRTTPCVSFQTSASSCVLLAEVPSASNLTASPGTLIFTNSDLLDGRIPQECPLTWTRIGNACYTTDAVSTSSALWEEDSSYCSSAYGPAATLPTFETEEQWGYFVSNITVRVWFNIRYTDGGFKMLGGSKSTFWSSKWEDGQPGSADGFAFFNARSGAMRAVPLDISPMPRHEVVCMLYAGEP